ncbi:hypothetical protein HUU51_02085 [Candidatus Gracilibacteria bacterium]|nr:hypothetical protein [Candidatus Gracilibacteria bacterium]
MKKSKIATTIAEAMVVMTVIVIGLTGIYRIYSESSRLSNSVEIKIQAIQIAREGIEAITNIRDTNWILYSSDKNNCWKTLNYNSGCIGNASPNNIANNGNYKVYRNSANRWQLESDGGLIGDDFSTTNYKDFYKIFLDQNSLYTHTYTGDTRTLTNTKGVFTRQIKTSYVDPGDGNTNNGLQVRSIVRWVDSGGTNINEIVLETILTNHK